MRGRGGHAAGAVGRGDHGVGGGPRLRAEPKALGFLLKTLLAPKPVAPVAGVSHGGPEPRLPLPDPPPLAENYWATRSRPTSCSSPAATADDAAWFSGCAASISSADLERFARRPRSRERLERAISFAGLAQRAGPR